MTCPLSTYFTTDPLCQGGGATPFIAALSSASSHVPTLTVCMQNTVRQSQSKRLFDLTMHTVSSSENIQINFPAREVIVQCGRGMPAGCLLDKTTKDKGLLVHSRPKRGICICLAIDVMETCQHITCKCCLHLTDSGSIDQTSTLQFYLDTRIRLESNTVEVVIVANSCNCPHHK